MPIYEFECEGCGAVFEELVAAGAAAIACPDCSATNVAKQFSSFAVHGAAKTPSVGGSGGGCCGGSCGCGH